MSKAKILIVDLENSPNLAWVWQKWKVNIGDNQFVEKSYVMSFAAKWLGEDHVYYEENRHNNDAGLVKKLYDLFDEADIVVGHNIDKFDLPIIFGRGLIHGFNPPSPFHTIDTLKVARKEFRFLSNSLAALCDELGLTKKGKHKEFPGFDLWVQCLKQNDKAWKEMKEYNIQDILSTEELYLRLRPYVTNHTNVSRKIGDEVVACPSCGSEHVQMRGFYTAKSGLVYHRFQCKECFSWSKTKRAEKDTVGQNILRGC